MIWEAGRGELRVGFVRGKSAVLQSRAQSPLGLLTPRSRGPSAWAYTSSLGGGMVAGDEVTLRVAVDEGARCFLGTQSSSKIYRNPRHQKCSHLLQATVAEGALLVLAPDPVQCFAEASYEQRQTFDLAPGASLIVIDSLSAGRLARDERWAFRRYFSRNEIRRNKEAVFLDAIELDASATMNKFRTGSTNCFATLVMTGLLVEKHAQASLDRIHGMEITGGRGRLLQAASPIPQGCVVRWAGNSMAEVAAGIQEHLQFVRELLADDPWSRKW